MMAPLAKRRPALLPAILFLVLLLAALLRFQNLGAIEHNIDRAYPIWQALMTLERGVLPIKAQSTSVLFDNPALTGYLFVPWVALTRSALGPYVFVITLNTLAVWLAYRAVAQLLGTHRALIAALLMAVNPWLVEYSRLTWVQALLPFFICLIFWLLTPILLGRAAHPARRVMLALVALTAMTQTYLLAFAALAPLLLLFIAFRRRVPWRAAALGFIIFALAAGAYGLALAADAENALARLRDFGMGGGRLTAEAWSHAVRLVSGQNYAIARGIEAPIRDWALRETLSEGAHYVVTLAMLAGAASAIYAIVQRTDRCDVALIALTWFGLPIAMMTYVSRPVHPFYLLLTLPAGALLAAWGFGQLLRWRWTAACLIPIGAAFAALMWLNTVRYAEETLATPGAHGFTALPLGAGMALAQALITDERPVFADADEWTLNSLAGRLFPVDRDASLVRTVYLPPRGAVYLRLGSFESDLPLPIRNVQTFTLSDGTLISRMQLAPQDAPPWLTQPTSGAPIPSDIGITYLGWQGETPLVPGQSASLLTGWRVDDLKPERAGWLFGPFVHVYDASGRRVAIGDGAVTPGAAWRPGEIHLQRIRVQLPADAVEPFALQFGQFDGVHGQSAIFILPDGSFSATISVLPASPGSHPRRE